MYNIYKIFYVKTGGCVSRKHYSQIDSRNVKEKRYAILNITCVYFGILLFHES